MGHQTLSLTFANTAFLPVLLNWFLSIRKLGLNTPTTIALDEPLHRFLSERGFPSVFRPCTGDRNELWKLRTETFLELLETDQSFLHSDADAIWLGDPWPFITSAGADITLSQGTIWPPDVVSRRGFVACCGFFHTESNSRTKEFFQNLTAHTAITSDDQVSLNRLFDDFDIAWDVSQKSAETKTYQGVPFRCFESTVFGLSKRTGLTVALLPHREFQRLHTPEHSATVKHLLKTAAGQDTKTHLQQEDCWFLHDDWQQIPFDEQTLENLMQEQPSSKPSAILPGEHGGAWTAETHKTLYPGLFNHGLAHYITQNFNPTTVLEFGSGLGDLARYIAENSTCETVHCIEPLIMPDDVKKNAKITQFTSDIFAAKEPDHFLPQYELVLSIEVAEHVERTNHDFLFDFLVKHCKKWIIFSGARVGQGGHGHIAERPEEEWRSELVSRGMHFRADLTSAARTACDQKNVNHRRNVMVFEKSR